MLNKNCSCADQDMLMRQIQEVDFLLVDLQLYLDNFPDCHQARQDFDHWAHKSHELKAEYCKQYGPLMIFGRDM